METTTDLVTDAAAVPAWPSMRGNSRNTGARLFTWDGVRRPIRHLDTAAPNVTNRLSLINATPIVGPDETIYIGSSSNFFFAFRADNGFGKWSLGGIVDSAGCFTNAGTIYFPCGDYSLYAVSPPPAPRTARRHPLKGSVVSYSTIEWFEGNVVADPSGRYLYAGCDNFFLFSCDSAGTQFFQWGFPTGFFIWSACAFSNDGKTAYFASADMTLYALDLGTTRPDDRQRWACELGNLCASSPALTADGRILIGAFDGTLYAIDASNGARLGTVDTGSLIYASPAVSDQDRRAFVVSSDGVLRAFDTRSARPTPVWEFFTGMPSFSSPSIGPDPERKVPYLIYVGTGDGSIFALTPDGQRRWSYDTAVLMPEWKTHPNIDPAYWLSLRYPAINSSTAIGNQGLATATSGGVIVSVPYDAYLREPNGFTRIPQDDYIDQLPASGLRLCYVSPAGRMAAIVVPPAGADITVDPRQTLTFAALARLTSAGGKSRTTFAQLPAGLTVTIPDHPDATWRISADGTQLYIDSPPASRFTIRVADGSGNALAVVRCQVRRVPQPSSPAEVLANGYPIEQMSVFSPFVVPALDQLGLATINIYLRFLTIQNGAAIAYAYESYSSNVKGAPRRNLVYLLTGTYADGAFSLQSGPSYYELTGAPVPIDHLTLSGVLSDTSGETRGGSLSVRYRLSVDSVLDWLIAYVCHWLGDLEEDLCEAVDRAAWVESMRRRADPGDAAFNAILDFVWRVITGGDLMAPWKMFNQDDELFWVGTYSLGEGTPVDGPAPTATYEYFDRQLTVTVDVHHRFSADQPPIAGILLFDDAAPGKPPVLLNYVDQMGKQMNNHDSGIIIQTLTVPDSVTGRLLVKVMVDLAVAQPTYVIQSA